MRIFLIVILHCLLFSGMCKAFEEWQTNEVTAVNGLDVKGTIEKFFRDLRYRIPEEFTIADHNFTIPINKYISGTFNVSKIVFTGLKELNATVVYGKFLALPKSYILTLENLNLNLDYSSDITLYHSKYLSLFGEGAVSISLKNLIFDGNISISILPVNASTTDAIDLDNALVNITGLLDNDTFSKEVGSFLGRSVTKVFTSSKDVLSKLITRTVNFIIQGILTHPRTPVEDQKHNLAEDLLNIFRNICTYLATQQTL